ncbi:MAG: hypothetical protein Q4F40_06025 [Akkermansia sp.]|nr:hypothetical protein [Akkermansia sp.]
MKYQTLSLALAALIALTPAYAQSSRGNRATRGAAAAAAEEVAPKSGVRFVICAPNGGKLPSPLYYQSGKDEYKQVRISGRIPTQRIKPIAGVISFYDQNPAPAADAADKKKGTAAAAKKPEIKPVMTINVPAGAGSKSVCIVVPGDTPAKAQTFFLNEADFPSKGVHLINLSPRPVTVSVSAKGDFTDAREKKVAPFRRDEGVNDKNSWHFTGGAHGDQVAFRITHRQSKKVGGKEVVKEVPLKMGKFLVSERQSQINVVVKAGGDNLKLMSIQVAND